jgi:hypothetical protein
VQLEQSPSIAPFDEIAEVFGLNSLKAECARGAWPKSSTQALVAEAGQNSGGQIGACALPQQSGRCGVRLMIERDNVRPRQPAEFF